MEISPLVYWELVRGIVVGGGAELWIPACAGMTGVGVKFTPIPVKGEVVFSDGASGQYAGERGDETEADASDDVEGGASDLSGLGELDRGDGQGGEGGV